MSSIPTTLGQRADGLTVRHNVPVGNRDSRGASTFATVRSGLAHVEDALQPGSLQLIEMRDGMLALYGYTRDELLDPDAWRRPILGEELPIEEVNQSVLAGGLPEATWIPASLNSFSRPPTRSESRRIFPS